MMSYTETSLGAENTRTHNFITQIIDEDLASGKHKAFIPVFRQSRMAICILVTQSLFA